MVQSDVGPLLAACRSVDADPIAALTLALAAIPSPPGRESAMADRMAAELEGVGARVRLDREFADSPSVIAELGNSEGPTIQWHGHLDAIDVPHAPPCLNHGRVHGRGTADMKGSLAAMVSAAQVLVGHGLPARGRVLITLHGMHESGGNEPLHALIRRGVHGDAVITGELGGGRELPIAGLGLAFWEITVIRAGPGMHENSMTADTVDPVEVGRLLHAELAAVRDRLRQAPGAAPKPSVFISGFHAGDYVNRVAVRATLSGTRRFDTGATFASITSELDALVESVRLRTGATIELRMVEVADAFAVEPTESIVVATREAHRALTGATIPLTRSRLATNAVHFVREAGIPAVGYGPDPSSNHGDEESIAIAELPRIAGCFALASEYYLRSGAAR